ncbi:TPA: DUF2971 domain-containing protein [Vibrio diabolicus]
MAVLKDQTLKFSSFDEFNDPFDCIAEYDVEASLEHFRKNPELYKQIGNAKGLSPAKRLQNKGIVDAGIKKEIESGALHHSVVKAVGILCLSHKDDNILMWSHYADNHKGFVVEFEVDSADAKYGAKAVVRTLIGYPVEYSENMPVITAAKGDFESLKKMFLTKSIDWEYESEYRVLTMDKGPGIHKFNGKLISRVIVGARASAENCAHLESLVDILRDKFGNNIVLDKATMIKGAYKLKTT